MLGKGLNPTANKPFGEVIESSLHEWTGQCWQEEPPPSYGSLVVALEESSTVLGICYSSTKTSLDTTRKPYPYQKTAQELRRDYPEIFSFLGTTIKCLTVGSLSSASPRLSLTRPEPPNIHTFLQEASQEIYRIICSEEQFVLAIFSQSNPLPHAEELLVAFLQHAQQKTSYKPTKRLLSLYALVTGADYRHIQLLAERIHALCRLERVSMENHRK